MRRTGQRSSGSDEHQACCTASGSRRPASATSMLARKTNVPIDATMMTVSALTTRSGGAHRDAGDRGEEDHRVEGQADPGEGDDAADQRSVRAAGRQRGGEQPNEREDRGAVQSEPVGKPVADDQSDGFGDDPHDDEQCSCAQKERTSLTMVHRLALERRSRCHVDLIDRGRRAAGAHDAMQRGTTGRVGAVHGEPGVDDERCEERNDGRRPSWRSCMAVSRAVPATIDQDPIQVVRRSMPRPAEAAPIASAYGAAPSPAARWPSPRRRTGGSVWTRWRSV